MIRYPLTITTMMYGYNGFGYGSGFGFFGGFLMIIFWVLVIFVFMRLMHHGSWNGHSKTPADILKERYAKGEITKEQFAEMKKDLEK